MNEPKQTWIRCCAGQNVHSDVLIRRYGDLVQLLGPSADMQFTAEDALQAADAIRRCAEYLPVIPPVAEKRDVMEAAIYAMEMASMD